MKKLALDNIHRESGAKMVPFAGYEMPLQYTSLKEEHIAVREAVGMFDVSHMGEFILRGEKALDLIQLISSNDASKLVKGKIQYSCMPNGEGGIVDDLLIYCLDEKTYMLVVNASNMEKDWNWIQKHNDMGVEMEDISDRTCLLAVQGPKAIEALSSLTSIDLEGMKYYTFEKGLFADTENVLVSATGYTGSGGFELYFDNVHAEKIWSEIVRVGQEYGLKPAGLGARDTLRLEKGFCLYGNDIDDTTSPLEAGLGWITKFSKDFIDSERLQNQKEEGITRKLVGFTMVERGIPRKDYPILDAEGNQIGHVTSGTSSPSLNEGIGMGYVQKEHSALDNEIFIEIRSKSVKAQIKKMPLL